MKYIERYTQEELNVLFDAATAYARQCRNMTLGRIWSVTAIFTENVITRK